MSPLVVAYGGGTNSCAMLVGLRDRGTRPDLILFADTGGEKPHTMAHIETMNTWLRGVGFPHIHAVVTVNRAGEEITLEGRCLDQKMLPSLAYGFKGCSEKHKRRPQDKYVNHWLPAREAWGRGDLVTKAIGYDVDEERRVRPDDKKYHYWYPVIEWGWDREECERVIVRAGLPLPGKSACFFCPASKKHEIEWLRDNHPDLFQRALDMERNAAENLTSMKGLGRRFAWADLTKDGCTVSASSGMDAPCDCFE